MRLRPSSAGSEPTVPFVADGFMQAQMDKARGAEVGIASNPDLSASARISFLLPPAADMPPHWLWQQCAKPSCVEAIVVATGAPRERGCPARVVLGVKAIEAPGVRAA